MSTSPAIGALAAIAALGLLSDGAFARQSAVTAAQSTVRFHHVHYRVGDPAAAMSEAARRLQGVRVIVQGLGVGVRAGREFVLFDRVTASEAAPAPGRPASDALAIALERLQAWGLVVQPRGPDDGRVNQVFADLPVAHVAFATDDYQGIVQRLIDRGVGVIWRRDETALFEAGDGLRVEIVRSTDREETFWCPMHPDVRSADNGACPVCGMALVPIPPPKIGEYRLDVEQVLDRGGFAGLRLAVREPDTHALVTKFTLVHEKLFHLFVVSRDLRYFAHVHPEKMPDGTFTLTHPLPPDEYMLVADFLPQGGTSQMVQRAIIVTGSKAPAATPDESYGLKVEVKTEDLAAGKHALLTFTVTDAKTGAPVTNLEPYLGAPAHMLIVRADLSDAIHAHPEERATGGPTVSFHPIIPAPGDYRGWIQFQRGGTVSTTAFDFSVDR